ncbi:STAS domain-containing protein [Streptomyces sp. NPDC004129]|uniref:STAS domain-containing protein n=1 Tax=Streptomyces sp. NPDC004533 TaxID=3154278 RepID=UPI0033BA19AD
MEKENARGPELLKVVTTTTDGITVVTAAGEIDHANTGALIQALALDGLGDRPRVVVDMRHVTFMDSSGINALIAAHRDLTQADGWLRLSEVQGSVLRALQIVGLDTLIPCCPSLREALTA